MESFQLATQVPCLKWSQTGPAFNFFWLQWGKWFSSNVMLYFILLSFCPSRCRSYGLQWLCLWQTRRQCYKLFAGFDILYFVLESLMRSRGVWESHCVYFVEKNVISGLTRLTVPHRYPKALGHHTLGHPGWKDAALQRPTCAPALLHLFYERSSPAVTGICGGSHWKDWSFH